MAEKNFEFDGNGVSIFGVKGYPHGKDWAMDIVWDENEAGTGYKYILTIVSPSKPTAVSGIEKVISDDTSADKGHLIDHIHVSSTTAVMLFLEGKLTKTDLMNAENADDTITLKNVEFSGRFFTVVIRSDWNSSQLRLGYYATIDANGEVV